jgi:peroxiredoxin
MKVSFEPRQIAGFAIVGVLVTILAIQYVLALGPATQRERESSCAALQPTLFNPMLGKLPAAAPDLEAVDYTGNKVRLSAYRGRVVFLNFWATWCPPCVEEMPAMEVLQRHLGDDAFTVLALSSDESWDKVHEFFPQGTNLTVLLDPPRQGQQVGPLAVRMGSEKLPETYLIDKQGNIRYYFVNKREWASPKAIRCIRSLLDE